MWNEIPTWELRKSAAETSPTAMETAATRRSGSALSGATTRCSMLVGTPVRRRRLKGRFRSPNPAAMLTARLHAAMIRLATITTSAMSCTVASRRAVEGSSASTCTDDPWSGKTCSRDVRARSTEPGVPSVATTTASTGSLARSASDTCALGQTVEAAFDWCPRRFERK